MEKRSATRRNISKHKFSKVIGLEKQGGSKSIKNLKKNYLILLFRLKFHGAIKLRNTFSHFNFVVFNNQKLRTSRCVVYQVVGEIMGYPLVYYMQL